MLSTSFNSGWRWRPKVNMFLEMTGDIAAWQDVVLPHDALIGAERSPDNRPGAATAFSPSGAFEYVKTFRAPEGYQDGRVELQFDGVYRHAVVYVNGVFAGQRPSGYTPFRVRIDPYLQDGDNEIRLECRTHLDSRWYSGAGIYRDVVLLQGGQVHIASDGLWITTPDVDAERAVIDVAATIENDSTRLQRAVLVLEVRSPDDVIVAVAEVPVSTGPSSTSTVRQRLTVAAPALWDVDDPQLYSCRTVLVCEGEVVDRVDTPFGVRTLQWDALHGLRLNGRAIKLRGGCIHHDNGVLGAASFARAEERRVAILKAAGYNAVRSAHNAMSTALLEACDRLGMLVMDEAFDTWTSPKMDFDYSLDLPTWWRDDLRAMVLRDRNHPSVVMYSIGNEIPEIGSPWGAQLGRDMLELVKALDDTRPVTNGINPFFAFQADVRMMKAALPGSSLELGINTLMAELAEAGPAAVAADSVTERIAESLAMLDVAGYNYADGRYELDLDHHPQRLILGTESDTKKIEGNWALVTRHPRVLGDFSWTAWDYLGEAGIGRITQGPDDKGFLGAYPWRLSWAGDIDITGHRRPVSYYREVVWGLRVEPYVAVHRPGSTGEPATPWAWYDVSDSWSWPGFEGQPIRVDVYADADEVALLRDGEPVGTSPVGTGRPFVATFHTTYLPGRLEAVALRAGRETGRTTVQAAGEVLGIQVSADRSDLVAEAPDLAFIDISLVDETGTVHPCRDRRITVVVAGAAVLQGLGSADPRSTDDYTGAECSTFGGRALAVVRTTGEGPIEVRVTAPDCEPATVALRAVRSQQH